MRLRYTLPALADLATILDYIADRSGSGSRPGPNSQLDRMLQRYPLAGAVTEDPTVRRIATTPYPYLIFYEATDDEVIIHAVRHGARDPSNNPGSA
jgi:toxin ParE1/3/4